MVKKKVTTRKKATTKPAKKAATSRFEVGDKAPAFTLPTDTDGDVSLADFKGKKHVVLYFYPKDNTPGCTTQACTFEEDIKAYAKLGAVVIGVSPDSVKSHNNFRTKYGLSFYLGADDGAKVAKQYGVCVEKSMYGRTYMGIQRATFLIKKDGTISHIWPKVSVTGHSEDVLAALKDL